MYFSFFLIIVLALVFDVLNGYNDGGCIIGTIVSSRALSSARAIFICTFFELTGILLIFYFKPRIAFSFVKLLISPETFTPAVIFAALAASIFWKIVTLVLGLPTSSSHTLMGGLLGASLFTNWQKISYVVLIKILSVLIITPILSLFLGYLLMQIILFFVRGATPQVNNNFKRAQVFTAAILASGHGLNEAQKIMGVMVLVMIIFGLKQDFSIPWWMVVICVMMMALGVASGGWTVARTLSRQLMKVKPLNSMVGQLSSAIVILVASLVGGPVSTSQVVSCSLIGAGSAEPTRQIRWMVARNILVAWLITIPVTAGLAALTVQIIKIFIKI